MEHRGPQQVEGDRGHREDDHAEPGVKLHDPDPPPGAMGPGVVLGSRPCAAGIALLDAPVGIRDQLRGAHARDAERRERQRQRRRGKGEGRVLA